VEFSEGQLPSDLNRDKLRHDLSTSLRLWRNLSTDHRAPHEQRKWLLRQLRIARQQRERLAGYFPIRSGEADPLDRHISRLERALDPAPSKIRVRFTSGGIQFAPNQARRSPSRWLTGVRLAEIFEAHFKRRATPSRKSDGTPSGAYIVFARACL